MKITDIKAYPVWVGSRNQMVVKVETDEGIYGLGESGLSGREHPGDPGGMRGPPGSWAWRGTGTPRRICACATGS